MKRSVIAGLAIAGGVICFRSLAQGSHHRLSNFLMRWMLKRMERVMQALPEGAPPKLILSVLPRLREQNDQIIAALEEQNRLLRGQHAAR